MVLRSIALFEIIKGTLALAACFGVLSFCHTDLHAAADAFLSRHGLNPENHYTRLFIETLVKVTHHDKSEILSVGIAYALIRFAEGYGLWKEKHWAEWFAVLSSGLFVPIEIEHIARHPTGMGIGILIINLAVIVYLGRLLVKQRAKRTLEKKAHSTIPAIVSSAH
jgi:uncharacterized membrane protein (DUF2068 family)